VIENEIGKKVTLTVRDLMRKWKIEPYDEDCGAGFMRHCVVRVGHVTGEVLVVLVTNADTFPMSKSFCRELVRRVPQVTSVVQNINTRNTNAILGERNRTLYGPGFILDKLCGLSFRISAGSFYQVNPVQTEVLYNRAIELANVESASCVMDAYCGTGTIGLVAAAGGAAHVIGVDSVAAAIRDARQNARHNGIETAEFVCADATEFMAGEFETPDLAAGEFVVLMDPPRSGSTPEFLRAAAALAPSRIVYISCNPQTQVRDARELARAGYRLKRLAPVDMFPHTDHIESIALFEPIN
jgi:23S rRNA (uracil1939-C5)-methyltransferase